MVSKAQFQGADSSCSSFASFTLSGFTNPVRLHPVYPCILGLNELNSDTRVAPFELDWRYRASTASLA